VAGDMCMPHSAFFAKKGLTMNDTATEKRTSVRLRVACCSLLGSAAGGIEWLVWDRVAGIACSYWLNLAGITHT
jgi:hypothetical protein